MTRNYAPHTSDTGGIKGRWAVGCALLLLGLALVGGGAHGKTSPTLCQAQERVVFSCPLQNSQKIVSLCRSPELTAEHGYVQYRFGRPGKVELIFPPQREVTQQQFWYAQYMRYQVDRVTVRFVQAGYAYTLFDTYEGDITPPLHQQGVQVTWPASRKEILLLCRQAAVGNLRDLSTVVRCDPESPFNFGNCP